MRDPSPNFTPQAQDLIFQSKILCISLGSPIVTPDHLLISLLQSAPPKIVSFLSSFNLNIREYVEFIISFASLDNQKGEFEGSPGYSDDIKSCLLDAVNFSNKLDHGYTSPEHFFFAIINVANGSTDTYLTSIGMSTRSFVQSYVSFLKDEDGMLNDFIDYPPPLGGDPFSRGPQIPPPLSSQPPQEGSSLDSFCIDITQLCRDGKIDPVIGRSSEIDRIIEILSRKNKNNPLLLGEPGVGKTACIEGLASAISEGLCPPFMASKKVFSVDLASMIAGTKYRGQFEQRLKNLIKECSADSDIFLFIDEIHTLVGAGNAEGAMDAVNILKPPLARGQITIIGSTTFSEYKKSIEKDGALSRRFETLHINEPSKEECLLILKGLKSSYEKHHGVHYSRAILESIVDLADQYMPSKFFPDKAIDLLDEAGAKLKIKNSTPPPSIVDIETQILSLPDDSFGSDEESSLMNCYDKEVINWQNSIDNEVKDSDVYSVLSKKTKIPVDILERSDISISLEGQLKSKIIGQDNAVSRVYNNILRSELGFTEAFKPTGSFLFLGSTGTGKTYLAKLLAYHYFGSKNIIRFDMSEYSEGIAVSKLTGASPGYVGYDEGGSLIEKIKKSPYSVVLFDEIEKAHPQVQQLLLQVLEEGEVEDNQGNKGFFHHSVVILTSNIGADLLGKSSLGFNNTTSQGEKVRDLAKSILSPELINRLDDIVVFNTLSLDDLIKIFDIEMSFYKKSIKDHGLSLDIEEEVKSFICQRALDSNMGARPLKKVISNEIINSILPILSSGRQRCWNKSRKIFFSRKGDVIKCKLKSN